jgi:RND family efflux transporter MFP subunit
MIHLKRTRNLIILIFLFTFSCKNGEIKSPSTEVVRVRLRPVTSEFVSIPVHTNGIFISSEELKLSFKTGGIVSTISVDEGDRVKKGDLLASLDLTEISANERQTGLAFDKALRDYTRAENLYKDSVGTLEHKQNLFTALNYAQLAHEVAKFNLTHSKIVAPDNGVILKQFVKANELVSPGYPVFLFGSSGKYWKVKAGVSDKDIVKINQGDSALVTVDAYPGVKFPGKVDQVGAMSNPYTGTFEIEITLSATDYRLASGFIAIVELFPAAKRSFCMIPVESVVEADGENGYVYTVNKSNEVGKMKIEIITMIGSMAAVNGIPAEITEVVSEGAAYLKDGMKVVVIR